MSNPNTLEWALDQLDQGIVPAGTVIGEADASIFEDHFQTYPHLLEIEGDTATFHTPAAHFGDAPTATLTAAQQATISHAQNEGLL